METQPIVSNVKIIKEKMLKLKAKNDNINKEIFTQAITEAYDRLVNSGLDPVLNVTSEARGEFSVTWTSHDGSLNKLGYWTDENIGVYCSHRKLENSVRNWDELYSYTLRASDFLRLCYSPGYTR